MLCYRLGCNQVILTDNDNKSLEHMKNDCKLNKISAVVEKLDWFDVNIDNITINTDNNNNNVVLVAGDVIYKDVLVHPFFNTVIALFKRYANNIDMYLCHIPRATVQHENVIEAIESYSEYIQYETIDPSCWRKGCCTDLCPEEDYMRARLYHITQR